MKSFHLKNVQKNITLTLTPSIRNTEQEQEQTLLHNNQIMILFGYMIILVCANYVHSWHSILTDHAHLTTHISHTIEHLRSTQHVEGGPHVHGITTDILNPTTKAFSKEFVEKSEKMIVSDIRSTYNTFKQAIVTTKVANAIAGIFAEVAAGLYPSFLASPPPPLLTKSFPLPCIQQVVWEDYFHDRRPMLWE